MQNAVYVSARIYDLLYKRRQFIKFIELIEFIGLVGISWLIRLTD